MMKTTFCLIYAIHELMVMIKNFLNQSLNQGLFHKLIPLVFLMFNSSKSANSQLAVQFCLEVPARIFPPTPQNR